MSSKTAMAAEYTEISIEEMETLVKRAFHAMHPKRGQHNGIYYYDLRLSKSVAVRIWTSIRVHSSSAKDVGESSIKVRLVSLKDGKGLEGKKEAIVKRTQGWRDNLTDRVETLVEKYDGRPDWWDNWAENRGRGADPDKAIREDEREKSEEEKARDEDGEGSGPKAEPPPPPARQYDPGQMRGDITDKQMNFLRILMRGMTQGKWEASGAAKVTGLDNYPKGPADVRGLSKGQASRLIDALKSDGPRYASDLTNSDNTTVKYDRRDP